MTRFSQVILERELAFIQPSPDRNRQNLELLRLPMFSVLLVLTLKARPTLRWLRQRSRGRTGNQWTFHGLPVGELASFLKTHESFKRDDAVEKLGCTQGQYGKI